MGWLYSWPGAALKIQDKGPVPLFIIRGKIAVTCVTIDFPLKNFLETLQEIGCEIV